MTGNIQELIEEIYHAADEYYNGDGAVMPDKEFDKKLEHLEGLVDENPELFKPGTKGYSIIYGGPSLGSQARGEKVSHKTPMLSLTKVKKEKDVLNYAKRIIQAGGTGFKIQLKFDGISVSSTYVDGKLTRMATRGNGKVGENISHILENADIVGMPHRIDYPGFIEVRGEMFMTPAELQRLQKLGEDIKSTRSAVSGSIIRLKGFNTRLVFNFSAFGALDEEGNHIEVPENLGFATADSVTQEKADGIAETKCSNNPEKLWELILKYRQVRKDLDIPTDGIVVRPCNDAEMLTLLGANNRAPRSQIAVKHDSDTEHVETVVEGVEYSVGKTGLISPVAQVQPREVEESTISNISCHNLQWAHDMKITKGSKVVITRSGGIIPKIVKVIQNPDPYVPMEVPTHCPTCGEPLDLSMPLKSLSCENEECKARVVAAVSIATAALGIKGLSQEIIGTLWEGGKLKTVSDLYLLNEEDIARTSKPRKEGDTKKPKEVGNSAASKIISHIEKSKNLDVEKYLLALGCPRGASAKISQSISSVEDLLGDFVEYEYDEDPYDVGRVNSGKVAAALSKRKNDVAVMKEHGVDI